MILGGVQSYWIYNVLEKEFLTTSAFSKGARRGLARNGHTVCASLSGLSAESTEMKGGKKEERRRKRRKRRERRERIMLVYSIPTTTKPRISATVWEMAGQTISAN